MNKQNLTLSRRRFLSMSAAAGGAAFLAACGGQTAAPSTTSRGAVDAVSFANNLFVMPDGAPAVMQYGPGDPMFSSLFRVNNVTLNDNAVQLGSMADVEAAVADGAISVCLPLSLKL